MSLKYQTDDPEQPPENALPQPKLPLPLYTYILIGSILAVFIVQCATGNALSSAILGDERSAQLAGFDKQRFLLHREYWRILTGACMHGGIVHLFFNSFALFQLGRIFEMLSNRAHLAITFLISAIGGNLLSLIFLPDVTSIGASGGIVGLLGYLTIYAFRRRQFISPAFRKNLLVNIGFMAILGLSLSQVVDNYGHLGGLITGAAYALIQVPSDSHIDPREASSFADISGLACLGIYIAACGFTILLFLRVV